ncbi:MULTISPECIES: DUF4191 domain-containing protein [unclassified Salinibacterium]|uniref:DUF4191 domain-containing protein n=1 Tax=unclassified Salinibacterium TaxID=2632331 RepID=UPI00174BD000|nr:MULTISPECIES: DUF4191 domain-containing protein [unclassified Salinibacterium]
MARIKREKKNKEPGRLKQMWQVFQMTRRQDPTVTWVMLVAFIAPIAVSIVFALWLSGGNVLSIVLTIITGVMVGLLLGMIVLGRRAERAAYQQISGQPGAVSAVLKNGLRRSWIANEEPVAFSPRTMDAVYRAVGKPGIVLISEGPLSRTQPMLDKERANLGRLVPTVPVYELHVGPDPESLELHRLPGAMKKFPKKLTKAEILTVDKRITSVKKVKGWGIPAGIDPTRLRAPRPR